MTQSFDPWTTSVPTPCRLGYVEHDGYQYCHEHTGWHHYTNRTMRCDQATTKDHDE